MTIEEMMEMKHREGVAEAKKEIAKNMKESGENIEHIVKYTGLTTEEIEAL